MPSSQTAETTRLRKSSDKGPIPRRLRFGAPQESHFQCVGNADRFNPAGNRSNSARPARRRDLDRVQRACSEGDVLPRVARRTVLWALMKYACQWRGVKCRFASARIVLSTVTAVILLILHPSITLGFQRNRLEDNLVIADTRYGLQRETETNRVNNLRIVNVCPIHMAPYNYNPLVIFRVDRIFCREHNSIFRSAIGPKSTIIDGGEAVKRFGKVLAIRNSAWKIVNGCPSREFVRPSRLLKNAFLPQFDSVPNSVGFRSVHGFNPTEWTFSTAC